MNTAVAAAAEWLRSLAETDRFNLVPYTSVAVPFRGRAPLAEESAVERAVAFLERQSPTGLSDPTDGIVTALTKEFGLSVDQDGAARLATFAG